MLAVVALSAYLVVVVIIGSGEDARVVPAVSWGVFSASFLLAAHTLIHVFQTLSTPCPVINDQPPQEKFPWRSPSQHNHRSETSSGIFTCFKLVTSFFDSEARRKKKWDAEKKKWRDLQQQLATLRSIRAQRAAIMSSLTSQEGKPILQVENEDVHWRKKPNKSCRHEKRRVQTHGVQQTTKQTIHFPWKS